MHERLQVIVFASQKGGVGINAQNLAKDRRLASAATTVAEREMQLSFLAKEEQKQIALENDLA